MVFIPLLPILLLVLPAGAHDEQAATGSSLGRQRALFGDVKFEANGDPDWRYQHVNGDAVESMVFFPMGRSDQRYFVNGKYVNHITGVSTVQMFLVYETLRKGVVHPEWKVPLDHIDVGHDIFEESVKRMHGLARVLAGYGWYIREPVSRSIYERVDAREGLALYNWDGERTQSLSYQYFDEDGVGQKIREQEVPKVWRTWRPPPFPMPLPITPEEEAATAKGPRVADTKDF